MKKSTLLLFFILGIFVTTFAQNTVTINDAKTALTFKKTQTNGVIVEKTYPLEDVTYTYEVGINTLSIQYNAVSRETIYFGLASLVTIDGVSGTAGVALLKDAIGNASSGGAALQAIADKIDTTNNHLLDIGSKVSTEAKQDTIIAKLLGLGDNISTETKQDTTISKLTILNAKVSTEAKQDTIIARLDSLSKQGEYFTKIGSTNTFLLKDSTVTLSGTTLLYWTACNSGFINAEIQFAGESTFTMLLPGMCYTESIWTDQKSKIVHEPSTATITATNGSQVHIIRKYR